MNTELMKHFKQNLNISFWHLKTFIYNLIFVHKVVCEIPTIKKIFNLNKITKLNIKNKRCQNFKYIKQNFMA